MFDRWTAFCCLAWGLDCQTQYVIDIGSFLLKCPRAPRSGPETILASRRGRPYPCGKWQKKLFYKRVHVWNFLLISLRGEQLAKTIATTVGMEITTEGSLKPTCRWYTSHTGAWQSTNAKSRETSDIFAPVTMVSQLVNTRTPASTLVVPTRNASTHMGCHVSLDSLWYKIA